VVNVFVHIYSNAIHRLQAFTCEIDFTKIVVIFDILKKVV